MKWVSNTEPPIIEVDPYHGNPPPLPVSGIVMSEVFGEYMPFNRQNVRKAPYADRRGQIVYQLSGGVKIRIQGKVVVYPSQAVWLVIDRCPPHCAEGDLEYIAYQLGDKTFGSFVYD